MSSSDCSGDCAEAAADDVGSDNGKIGCGSEDADAEEAAGAEEDDEEEPDGCNAGVELCGEYNRVLERSRSVCCTGSSSKRTRFGEASFCTGGGDLERSRSPGGCSGTGCWLPSTSIGSTGPVSSGGFSGE